MPKRFKRAFRKFNRFSKRSFRKRRMFRRMFRKTGKPEIKWVDIATGTNNADAVVNAGAFLSAAILPTTMAQGTNIGQRIGNRIKTRYVRFLGTILSAMDATAPNHFTVIRVLILSPRIDTTPFQSALVAFNPWTQSFDTNSATVYFDRDYTLSNLASTVTNYGVGNPGIVRIHRTFRHPRNINFRNGASTIDDARDQLYFVVYNKNQAGPPAESTVAYHFTARTTYTDY